MMTVKTFVGGQAASPHTGEPFDHSRAGRVVEDRAADNRWSKNDAGGRPVEGDGRGVERRHSWPPGGAGTGSQAPPVTKQRFV